MQRMKRMIRFLKGLPRIVQRISFSDHPPTVIRAYVDSDWAGCRKTRKSTSGGVALSSGEADYYAALKGACVALVFQSMPADLS